MIWLIIGIIIVVITIAIVKGNQKPKKPGRLSFFDAVNLLTEEHGKEKKQATSNQYKESNNLYIDEDDENITNDDLEDILFDLEEYTENDDSIELPIRGINFRGLSVDCLKYINGFIMPDLGNEYDTYAIGIYASDGTHLGFVEKGQKALYNKIEENQGSIDVDIDIDTFIDEDTGETRFCGNITIDKSLLL